MILKDEYPKEYFLELKGLSPYIVGRITITKIASKFMSEIDLILKESGKIYKHIDILYNYAEEEDVLSSSVQNIKKYLDKIRES